MRGRYAVLLLVAISLTVIGPVTAQPQSVLKVRELMSADDFRRCGLQRLDESEIAALDKWVSDFAVQILAMRASGRSGSDCTSLEGAIIVADDGEFLGKITTSSIDSKSITNSIGRHGSQISSTSIFNQVGSYGSKISHLSPFNSITSTPPRVYKDGQFVGYLTVNEIKSPRIDPHALIGCLKGNE